MADNTTLSVGTGGDVMRDKDRSGVKTPIVGLDLNPAGAETLMTGAMPVTGTFWQATQPVSGTVAISGTVAVASVGGSVEITNDAGNPIPVSGTVAATQSGAWSVTVGAALPAGTNLVGQVSASHETGTVYNGTTALTPKFALISASASGVSTVVAAVATKRIRVLRWSLSANGAVNVKWQSHVTPTDLTGLHYMTQFSTAGGAYCPQGIFQTVAGEALDLNLSAAVAVGGELTYVEV